MKQKKAGKGLYVSKSKFAQFIVVIVIVIFASLMGNIVQLRKNMELKSLSERMMKQSSSVQEDKNELEKLLKEKEEEIADLKNSLTAEADLKANVELVKNLRASNEKLQKKVEELQASVGNTSNQEQSSGTTTTTTATTVATTVATTAAVNTTTTAVTATTAAVATTEAVNSLVADNKTKYFHRADCQYVGIIDANDKVTGTKEKLESEGYKACTYCNP